MTILVGTARKTDEFPQVWPEPPRKPESEYDVAWGKGYDAAFHDQPDNPYDAVEEPLSYAEWEAGWNDAQKGGFSGQPIERRKLDQWFKDEGVED